MTEISIRSTEPAKLSNGTLSGYAVLWETPSRLISEFGKQFVETIQRGAFDLNPLSDIKLYYNHNATQPLARQKNNSLRLFSDEVGIRYEADLPQTQLGSDVANLVSTGVLSEMSFAYRPTDFEWGKDQKTKRIRSGNLFEISVVIDASYPNTSAVLKRSLSQNQSEIEIKRIQSFRRKTNSL